MNVQYIGILAALGATIIWSGNFIVSRAIAFDISPLELNFWRWAIATIVILPFAIKSMCREWPQIWQNKWYILFMSLIGIVAMGVLTYTAGQSTSSINMSLLTPSTPIFIMILSRIIYNEPITPRRLCAIIIILAGIFSIISKGDITNILNVQFASGDIWILVASFIFGLYSLYIRQCPKDISLATFNGFTFLIGTLMMLPFVLFGYITQGIPTFSEGVIISILYTGIGCSVISYVLWAKAISTIGPVKSGFIYYTIPFFTATSAFLLFDERITIASAIGGICIIAGILVATYKN